MGYIANAPSQNGYSVKDLPFIQFYVADYLADTTELSTEEHGAYFLLMLSMWRAGGTLPNEPRKLARICRLSTAKWSRVGKAVLPYFQDNGETITHKRIKKDIENAQNSYAKRAEAGAKGGAAKSLKNNEPPPSNAKAMLKHSLSNTHNSELIDNYTVPRASHDWKEILDGCRAAAGDALNPTGNAALTLGQIKLWIEDPQNPCDPYLDIIPAIEERAASMDRHSINNWSYFRNPVLKYRDARLQGLPTPKEMKNGNTGTRGQTSYVESAQRVLARLQAGDVQDAGGSEPGPGCGEGRIATGQPRRIA